MKSRPEFPPGGRSSPLLTPKIPVPGNSSACGVPFGSDDLISQQEPSFNVNPSLTLTVRMPVNNG